jgi:hypothetical protein
VGGAGAVRWAPGLQQLLPSCRRQVEIVEHGEKSVLVVEKQPGTSAGARRRPSQDGLGLRGRAHGGTWARRGGVC